LVKPLVSRKRPGAGATSEMVIAPAPVLNFKLSLKLRQNAQLRLRSPGANCAVSEYLNGLNSVTCCQITWYFEVEVFSFDAWLVPFNRPCVVCRPSEGLYGVLYIGPMPGSFRK